jgi:SAM-dependent MidA family methyltransferase
MEQINREDGWISFEHYMDMALFTPGLGYYAADREVFGAGGDFVTAPVIGSLFATCLAGQVAETLHGMAGSAAGSGETDHDVIEFGAGTGALAVALLNSLGQLEALPRRYLILEPGASLRTRQQDAIDRLPEALRRRVHWIDRLPENLEGVVLANEVLDAMPVNRFRINGAGDAKRLGVTVEEGAFAWQTEPAGGEGSSTADGILKAVTAAQDLAPGYESEFSRMIPAWITSVAESLSRGLLLLADYGYDRRTYYHPDRSMGTLMCHYRHHAHGDPFILPGLQDITAHVDFTAVAEAACGAGLDLLGYSDQAGFLLEAGLAEIYTRQLDAAGIGSPGAMALAAEARRLTMPHEMGDQFKLIALGRGVPAPAAFQRRNLASRLQA